MDEQREHWHDESSEAGLENCLSADLLGLAYFITVFVSKHDSFSDLFTSHHAKICEVCSSNGEKAD